MQVCSRRTDQEQMYGLGNGWHNINPTHGDSCRRRIFHTCTQPHLLPDEPDGSMLHTRGQCLSLSHLLLKADDLMSMGILVIKRLRVGKSRPFSFLLQNSSWAASPGKRFLKSLCVVKREEKLVLENGPENLGKR